MHHTRYTPAAVWKPGLLLHRDLQGTPYMFRRSRERHTADPKKQRRRQRKGNLQAHTEDNLQRKEENSMNRYKSVRVDTFEASITWTAKTLREDCKIVKSVTAPQEHLQLKSQIPFGLQVFCKVLQLRAFQQRPGQLLLFLHEGSDKPLLLALPPGSVVLQRHQDWPPGVYAAFAYDLWPEQELNAVLAPLYFVEGYPTERTQVYLVVMAGNISAAGVLRGGNQFVERASARTFPFTYETLYGDRVPVGLIRLQEGMGLRLGRVPEAFLFYDDLTAVSRGGMGERIATLSELGRDVEELQARYHRLILHSHRQEGYRAALMKELTTHLPLLQSRLKRLHAAFMAAQQAPPGSAIFDLIIQLNYLDMHSRLSVLLRFPCHLRGFQSMRDLAPQVRRALLLLLQAFHDPFSVPAATAAAATQEEEGEGEEIRLPKKDKVSPFFIEATETALHLLSSGYCRACPDGEWSDEVQQGRCGMCGATRVGSIAILSLNDISPSADTLPPLGYWKHRVTEDFLLRVSADGTRKAPGFYGVELDHHTDLDLPPQLSESFATYGRECIRTKQIEELRPLFGQEGLGMQCPSASPLAMNCVGHLSFVEAAPVLVASDLLLQHLYGACAEVKPSKIVTECLEQDKELLGFRRLRSVQPLGRTRLHLILYELILPSPSEPFLQTLVGAKATFQEMPPGPIIFAVLDMVSSAQTLLGEKQLPSLVSLVFGWSGFLLELALNAYGQTRQSCYLFTSGFFEDPVPAIRMLVENNVPPPTSPGLQRPVPQYDDELEQAALAAEEGKRQQEAAAAEAKKKRGVPLPAAIFSTVDRTTLQRLPVQQVQQFLSNLRTDFPLVFAATYRKLGWPEDRSPQNPQELLEVEGAYYQARAELNEELIPDVFAQFYRNWLKKYEELQALAAETPEEKAEREARLKQHITPPPYYEAEAAPPYPVAPEEAARAEVAGVPATRPAEEAAAPAAPETVEEEAGAELEHAYILPGKGAPPRFVSAWPYVRRQLVSNFGPSTRMPVWAASSPTCPCADPTLPEGCLLDTVKTTSDVVFRLSMLIPPAVERLLQEHGAARNGGRGSQLSPELAAFCTTAGLFANVWQQQAVATGYEESGSRRASSILLARLAKQDAFLLKLSADRETRGAHTFGQRRKLFRKFIRNPHYRECRALLAQAGALAYTPYRPLRRTASSLYGAIANAVGVSFGDQQRATAGFIRLSEALLLQRRRLLQLPKSLRHEPRYKAGASRPLTALLAALHVSSIFKDCFSAATGWQPRIWYYMHLDGRRLLQRAIEAGWPAAETVNEFGYGFGEPKLYAPLFENAFRNLSKAITPSWEAEDLFRTLAKYTPAGTGGYGRQGRMSRLLSRVRRRSAPNEQSFLTKSGAAPVDASRTSLFRRDDTAGQQQKASQQQQGGCLRQHSEGNSGNIVESLGVFRPGEGFGDATRQQGNKQQRQRKKREQQVLPTKATFENTGPAPIPVQTETENIGVRTNRAPLHREKLQFVTSLRYRAIKRREEGTAFVNLVLQLSHEELQRLPQQTAAGVLQLLQRKILASAAQLAAQTRHADRQQSDARPVSTRVTAGRQEAGGGRVGGEDVDGRSKRDWHKELMALASYLERDAHRTVPHASVELNRWSLPLLSAGALLFSAFKTAIEHQRAGGTPAENLLLLVVQIPDKLA